MPNQKLCRYQLSKTDKHVTHYDFARLLSNLHHICIEIDNVKKLLTQIRDKLNREEKKDE